MKLSARKSDKELWEDSAQPLEGQGPSSVTTGPEQGAGSEWEPSEALSSEHSCKKMAWCHRDPAGQGEQAGGGGRDHAPC